VVVFFFDPLARAPLSTLSRTPLSPPTRATQVPVLGRLFHGSGLPVRPAVQGPEQAGAREGEGERGQNKWRCGALRGTPPTPFLLPLVHTHGHALTRSISPPLPLGRRLHRLPRPHYPGYRLQRLPPGLPRRRPAVGQACARRCAAHAAAPAWWGRPLPLPAGCAGHQVPIRLPR
jgi:hypothetical protein